MGRSTFVIEFVPRLIATPSGGRGLNRTCGRATSCFCWAIELELPMAPPIWSVPRKAQELVQPIFGAMRHISAPFNEGRNSGGER